MESIPFLSCEFVENLNNFVKFEYITVKTKGRIDHEVFIYCAGYLGSFAADMDYMYFDPQMESKMYH